MSTGHTTVTFHRIDPNRVTELIAMLDREGFRHEFGGAAPIAPLQLFHPYAKHFATAGICRVLPDRIRTLDPSAGFTVTQDATAELPGEQSTTDPELGDITTPADHHGRPLIPAADLRGALQAARNEQSDLDELLALLDELAGGPWQRQIALLRALRGARLTELTTT